MGIQSCDDLVKRLDEITYLLDNEPLELDSEEKLITESNKIEKEIEHRLRGAGFIGQELGWR